HADHHDLERRFPLHCCIRRGDQVNARDRAEAFVIGTPSDLDEAPPPELESIPHVNVSMPARIGRPAGRWSYPVMDLSTRVGDPFDGGSKEHAPHEVICLHTHRSKHVSDLIESTTCNGNEVLLYSPKQLLEVR